MTQIGIFGKICASSQQGHKVPGDLCSFYPINFKQFCLSILDSKYAFNLFFVLNLFHMKLNN